MSESNKEQNSQRGGSGIYKVSWNHVELISENFKNFLKAKMVDFIHFPKNYYNIICGICTMSIIAYTDGFIYVGRKMKSETILSESP